LLATELVDESYARKEDALSRVLIAGRHVFDFDCTAIGLVVVVCPLEDPIGVGA
jgi:hypothetical protein